jgi:hypothetical protein
MAAAPVTIAPILTPRTVNALAGALQETQLGELASALRGLQPFLEGGVEEFFVPLSGSTKKGGFRGRFNRLSRDYEPFRIYLLFKLIGFFQNQDLLGFYGRILRDILGPLLNTADEMDMAPGLIAALVRDYLNLIERVRPPNSDSQPKEMTFDQFSLFVDCLHKATRFDYGLTAVFLVLEGSIAEPTSANKIELLTECKTALFDLARSCIKALEIRDGSRFLDSFESNKLEIAGSGRHLRVVPHISRQLAKHFTSPRRQTEIDWIKRNTEISEEYRGKWVVLEKDELVASDKDYGKARAIAKERGIKRPFIVFVPSTASGRFMGI